ncbi:MAG: EAL domain-containing protein [Lachnospiraceae bacterium]
MDFKKKNTSLNSYAKILLDISDNTVLSVNEEFEKLTGYTQEEILETGMKFYDFVPDNQIERLKENVQIQLNTSERVLASHYIRDKAGFLHPVAGMGHDYFDEMLQKHIIELIIVGVDLSQETVDSDGFDSRFFGKVLSQLGFGVAMFAVSRGRIIPEYFEDTLCDVINYTREQLKSINDFSRVIYDDDVSKFKIDMLKCVSANDTIINEYRIKKVTGGYVWYQLRMALLEYREGVPVVITTFVNVNIGKQNELDMRLHNEMLTALIEDKKEQLLKYDVDEDSLSVNGVVAGVLTESYSVPNYLANMENNARIYKDDKELFKNVMTACSKSATRMKFEVRMRVFSGEYLWHRINLVSVADAVGNVQKVYGRLSEIHEEKMEQEWLKNMAEKDSLTGLYNHSSYIEHINREIEKNRGTDKQCALFMLDLDDFKLINDMLGHYSGDELLEHTGARILDILGEGNLAGRIGGDEFSIFLSDLAKEDADSFASKLHKKLCKKVVKAKHTVSMGYEVMNYKDASFDELYLRADQALYTVKRNGKNKFLKYQAAITDDGSQNENENEYTYITDEGWIVEKISEPLCVSDVGTYDLLYVNDALKKALGIGDSDWEGKKCYQVAWNLDEPCESCKSSLAEDDSHTICSTCIKAPHYIKIERIIRWKNRRAKLTLLLDTRNTDDVINAIKNRYDMEDALFACVANLSATNEKSSYRYLNVLKTIGEYYGADEACLIEFQPDGIIADYHEWSRDKARNFSNFFGNMNLDNYVEFAKPFSNESGIVAVENLSSARKSPGLAKLMEANRVWSLYGIPLRNENGIFAILVMINLKKRAGELKLLRMVSESLGNEILREQLWKKQVFDMYHDPLTGLYNRRYYNELLGRHIESRSVGVVFADVNDVAKYNDDFGFAAGNALLVDIAGVFKKHFGNYNVFRFDSDDFVVYCENIDRNSFINIVSEFKEDVAKHGSGVSCGFVWDDYDMDVRKLCRHAEEMMETAKEKYHEHAGSSTDIYKKKSIFRDVRKLVADGNFRVYLQPKMKLTDDSLCGAEALIRLYMPEYGIIAPGSFVDLLEKAGAIEIVDLFVLEEICRMFTRWQEMNIPLIPVSFNFSRKTITSPTIFESVEEILSRYDIPRKYLEIEITESVGDIEYEAITEIAEKFHAMGFSLAMDDFGTKYSSIAVLSHMNFDILKIDRSLVNNLVSNDISRKVLKHIVHMCTDLGIECIAEGVENCEQADILKELECNTVQGYLYDKPLPMVDFYDKYILPNGN